MSIFRQRVEERAEQIVNIHPGAQTGWAVQTKDVITDEIEKNAFFRAINNMSGNDAARLKIDSTKAGLSFVTKAPGVSRGEKVYLNPKTMQQYFGTTWGKTGDIDLTGSQQAMGDMVFSGNNNQLPTIFGLTVVKPVHDQINYPTAAKEKEKPAEDKTNKDASAQDILPSPVNPDTGKKMKGSDPTKVNIMNGNSRTGTVLVTNSEIELLSSAMSFMAGGIF